MQRLSCLLLVVLGLAEGSRVSRDAKASGVGAQALSLWRLYAASVQGRALLSEGGGFQAECGPQVHAETSAYRGAIMLLHGFTACPQQFKKLIPLLTSSGFTVFTPVNPGHGYKYRWEDPEEATDDISDMPTNKLGYTLFSRQMHNIMRSAPGEKAIFGLSVGGGIAAWQGYLGGYDRIFLAVPMLKAKGRLNSVISVLKHTPFAGKTVMGWGAECEEERKYGRAGICHFTPQKGAAARDIGLAHYNEAKIKGPKFRPGGMQIAFLDDDGAVDTDAVIDLGEAYGLNASSPNICGFDHEIGHSFLAPEDNVGVDMYWLDDVTQGIADYLADGKPMLQGPQVAQRGYPRCLR